MHPNVVRLPSMQRHVSPDRNQQEVYKVVDKRGVYGIKDWFKRRGRSNGPDAEKVEDEQRLNWWTVDDAKFIRGRSISRAHMTDQAMNDQVNMVGREGWV